MCTQILHGYPFTEAGFGGIARAMMSQLSLMHCERNQRGLQDVSYNVAHHASVSPNIAFYRFLDSHDDLLIDQQMFLALDNQWRSFTVN